MAFPAQTITAAKVATSHVRMRINSADACVRHHVVVGPVRDVTDIATGMTLLEHKGHNADGTAQVAYIFELEKASGKVRVTLDEVYDLDGVTWDGEQIDVDLTGVYQAASTKGWRFLAPKAYVNIVSFKPNIGSPSQTVVEIIPYNSPDTPAWSFNDDYTV
jgi:hypothetical protein